MQERRLLLQMLLAFGAVSLALAAVAAPWLAVHGWVLSAWMLRSFFAQVCHQLPERSFWIMGAPVAVCVRCLGIYIGAGLGAALVSTLGPAARIARRTTLHLFVTAIGLNTAEFAAELAFRSYDLSLIRFTTGLALGIAASALLLAPPSLASHGIARRR